MKHLALLDYKNGNRDGKLQRKEVWHDKESTPTNTNIVQVLIGESITVFHYGISTVQRV